jgi:hypothetical protein
MNYTNDLNLPQYIVDWLINDNYDHNTDPYTISATTLMKPTRAHVLALRHKDNLQRDVADNIAARVGGALHDSIEQVETPGIHKEHRARREFPLGPVVYTVTGKYDILEEHSDGSFTLRDIKTTSVWAYIYGGKDEEYRKQLSIYRWLLSQEKEIRNEGYIDFFFTDWQSSKAKSDKDYPSERIKAGHRIQLWSLDETEDYIRSRLQLVEDNRGLSDENLVACTKQELWAGDEKFAVMKPAAKRATKLCDTRSEAEQYITAKKMSAFVERRPPKVKRCKYCAAFPFCNQGQHYHNQGMIAR